MVAFEVTKKSSYRADGEGIFLCRFVINLSKHMTNLLIK